MTCTCCGACCQTRHMWLLSSDPMIRAIAGSMTPSPQEGSCDMYDGDCMLEKYLGREAKPEICRNYLCEKENQ
jgi:hypothetical protein